MANGREGMRDTGIGYPDLTVSNVGRDSSRSDVSESFFALRDMRRREEWEGTARDLFVDDLISLFQGLLNVAGVLR